MLVRLLVVDDVLPPGGKYWSNSLSSKLSIETVAMSGFMSPPVLGRSIRGLKSTAWLLLPVYKNKQSWSVYIGK